MDFWLSFFFQVYSFWSLWKENDINENFRNEINMKVWFQFFIMKRRTKIWCASRCWNREQEGCWASKPKSLNDYVAIYLIIIVDVHKMGCRSFSSFIKDHLRAVSPYLISKVKLAFFFVEVQVSSIWVRLHCKAHDTCHYYLQRESQSQRRFPRFRDYKSL